MTAPRVASEATLAAEAEEAHANAPALVGPQSPFALLAGKREGAIAKLFIDQAVPRWEDELGRTVWVRFKPSNPAFFGQAVERREKAHQTALRKGGPNAKGNPDRVIDANADLLAECCIAVYDLAIDEEPPDELDGTLPDFRSTELSEALGVPNAGAAATVRALYLTDGDLLIASGELMEWSGKLSKQAHADFLTS